MLSSFSAELEAFRAFADALPIFIWMQNEPGKATWVNTAFMRYLGLDARVTTLPSVFHLLHPDDSGPIAALVAAGIEAQRPFALEFRMRPENGHPDDYRWHTIRLMPVRDGDTVATWVGTALDVHEARVRELEAREIASIAHLYRELAENVPGMVWNTDANGVMTYANSAWYETFALTASEAHTSGYKTIVHPDDYQTLMSEYGEALKARTALQIIARMRVQPTGEYHTMLVHGVPTFGAAGAFTGFVGMTVDIQSEVERSAAREANLRRFLDSLPAIAWRSRGNDVEWYNARWYQYTGFSDAIALEEQWMSAVHPDDLNILLEMAATKESVSYEYRLRGADGQYRWHLGRRSPLVDEEGALHGFIGTATDIDRQKRIEEQLRFTAAVGEAFNATQSSDELVARVAAIAVPSIADYAIFWLADRNGKLRPGATRHRDPRMERLLAEYVRLYPTDRRRAATRPTVRDIDDAAIIEWSIDERQLSMLRRLGPASIVATPIEANGQFFGTLCLARVASSPSYSEDDLRFIDLLARRLGTALENIRVYERERNIADTFQQAALPKTLPALPGLALSAVYRAAEDEARVGGDWYDAFSLDDGRLVVAVGDVTGKGLEAAVTMSSVRQGMRFAAYEGHDPAGILFAVDRALRRDTPDRLVTAFVGIIDRQSSRMTYANAGHSWPVLRHADAQLTTLAGSDPPLGLLSDRPVTRAISMPSNALLVLYTDGLVESSRDLLQGERWLHDALQTEAVAHASDPARYLFESIIARSGGQRDDVAVLAISTGRSIHWSFNADDAMAAHGARSAFVHILRETATPESDFYGAELIFGELVGNVVRHAPGQIDIALDWSLAAPVLHVLDRGLGFDAPDIALPEDAMSETSRGLYLVATLGRDFSLRRLPGRGTHARVSLPVRRA